MAKGKTKASGATDPAAKVRAAKAAGAAARGKGRSASTCPYAQDHDCKRAWLDGWYGADEKLAVKGARRQ